jgi:sulfiredoxin
MRIEAIPIKDIQRPLYRQNDQNKVEALMQSIQEIGLQEPIDVLEVDGKYYGFSGCHRYEACTRLGHETILCKVRRAPRSVLKMHLA